MDDAYDQYELLQAHPEETHLNLYRGINRIDEHEILETLGGGRYRGCSSTTSTASPAAANVPTSSGTTS
jgi:hypothetical protein